MAHGVTFGRDAFLELLENVTLLHRRAFLHRRHRRCDWRTSDGSRGGCRTRGLRSVLREGYGHEEKCDDEDRGYNERQRFTHPHSHTTPVAAYVVPRVRRIRCALVSVSYTHLRAHETPEHLVCRL